MGRRALVPIELRTRPFTTDEARAAGLQRWHLEGSNWRAIAPGIYVWAGIPDSPLLRLAAARLRLPQSAAFSGLTALWLHGLDVKPCDPIDVTVPPLAHVSARSGMLIRRDTLSVEDVIVRRGYDATTAERAIADLSRRGDLIEVVVVADAALHAGVATIRTLTAKAALLAGEHGARKFRRVIELAEPASESPMESRLRMVIVLAGLPRPLAQFEVYDRFGELLGRPDLYYPDKKLGIEYDGAVHRLSLAEDDRRQNRFLAEGITLLRFTANDVFQQPDRIVAQVRGMRQSR